MTKQQQQQQQQPITPPQDLVEKWIPPQWKVIHHTFTTLLQGIADNSAQWSYAQREPEIQAAADQELEACCEWLDKSTVGMAELLRAARRPKPLSLKEQALEELDLTADSNGAELSPTQVDLIRRALEALPE
jgi:hypothetical protein